MEVFIVQFLLGIVLFFLINWIGKHSYSIGYISISAFIRVDEAPAFNFVLRVLTPAVYLIIVASIMYSFNLDHYVFNFYLVAVYYIGIRLMFNLITERGLLLNWKRQFIYWISISLLSYLTYDKLISVKTNILPDFTTLANELWIIILIFLYQIFNKIELSNDNTVKRKDNYLDRMLTYFENKYSRIIDEKIENEKLKGLVYSILIIENFNRPKIIRWIEYVRFFIFRRPHTLGVMQYYTSTYLNDEQSVRKGVDKITDAYEKILIEYQNELRNEYFSSYEAEEKLIGLYNSGDQYLNDVREMWSLIMDKRYPDSQYSLLPEFDE